MSDNILNISNWKQDYPFLDSVWNAYMQFDRPVQQTDTNKTFYESVCHHIISDLQGDILRHKPYCMKLIRNLGHYYTDIIYFDPTYERCDILYNWLYHSSQSEKIPDDIIEKCFIDYNVQMKGKNKFCKCSYDLYKNMVLDQMKLNILNLFHYNAEKFRERLMDTDDSNKTRCQKFVCECVKIYQNMNELFCINGHNRSERHTTTCSILDQFKGTYNLFLTNLRGLYPTIPLLDDKGNNFFAKCRPDEQSTLLKPDNVETRDHSLVNGLSAHTGELDRALTDGLPGTHGNEDNPMRKTITTIIGTFAGASSLLALLYKFTPAGRLVNSKLRRTTGIINNNFYGEEANGMLFGGNEHNGFNSYNIGYEAV